MRRATSPARLRARWAAPFVILGACTLSSTGAHAQDAAAPVPNAPPPNVPPDNTPPATDPNVITGFHLTYGITANEILTDNANGTANGGNLTNNANGTVTTTPGSKRGDLITQITPNISVFDMTRDHQAGLIYTPSYQKYLDNSNLDRFDNTLFTSGHTAVWDNRLTFDTSSSISRQIINQQGNVTNAGISNSTNQTTVQTYTVSPGAQWRFGDFAVGQLQYLFGYTSSGALAPTTQNQATASLTSGTDFNNIQWGLQIQDSESDQGSQPNAGQVTNATVNPTTTGNLSDRVGQLSFNYALNRAVTLLSSAGYEQIHDDTNSLSNTSGPIGSVGVGLTGSKLNLTVNYNWRYGGHFISSQGTYNITEQLKAQLTYGTSVTTTQNQLIGAQAGSFINNTGVPVTVNGQTFAPGSTIPAGVNSGAGNQAIRDTNGQFLVTGNYDRNTYTLTVVQDHESTDTTNFNQNTVSVAAGYGRDLTPATHFSFNVGYLRIDQTAPTANTNNTYNASAAVSWNLGQDLTATATLASLYRQSSTPGQNVSTNSLTVGLSKNF